jgi:hypothetical protein
MRSGMSVRLAVGGFALVAILAGSAGAQTAAIHAGAGYRSPGTNAIACEFSRPTDRTLISLLWRPSLPAGWTLLSASGDGGPEVGAGGIVFLGSQLTNNPLRFSYDVSVPAGQTGARTVGGEAEYQYDNMWNPDVVRALPDPLVLSQLFAIAVSSPYGGASPPAGTNFFVAGSVVVCAITNSPVASGTRTQFVAYGWAGAGSVPASGAGTNVAVTLTNNSSIAWLWNTQNLFQVTAGPNGSVSSTGGWFTAGAILAVTASPAAHYHFAGWSGDVSGLSTNANPLSLTSTVARAITANFQIDRHSLVVTSRYGNATPPVGTNLFDYGSLVSCRVTNATVASGTRTQFVAYGWAGTGSVPASGAGTNVAVTLTNNSSIAWLWNTQNLFQVTAGPNGSVSSTGGWFTAGAILAVTASPAAHYHFAGWSGDVSGLSTNANPLSLTSTAARAITANFQIDRHSLLVTSRYGNATPPVGTNLFDYGSLVTCRVTNSPVAAGNGTQYVAYGWTGAGSVPASGAATNVAVTLTNNSSIAWLWSTQYWVAASDGGGGSVNWTGSWVDAGGVVALTALPQSGFLFDRWTGDVAPGQTNALLSITADVPRSVQALFAVDGSEIYGTQTCAGYRSPSTNLVISCAFVFPSNRQLTSLVWSAALPAGWALRSASGAGNPVVVGNDVRFSGALSASPLGFTCVLDVPGNQALSNLLAATQLFGFAGLESPRQAAAAGLWVPRYHSADYRPPFWQVDESEVNRILGYWRAGGYYPEPRGFDGFAPTNSPPPPSSTNAGLHSADYRDTRWMMDGQEVNRVLAYWRAGGYAVDPSGFDGYAAAAGPGLRAEGKAAEGVSITQSSGGGYDPGGYVTISNEFSTTGVVRSLLWRPIVPAGWRLAAVSGNGSLEFHNDEILWTGSMPSNPIAMTYSLEVPIWEVRTATVRAHVEYQLGGMVNPATAEPSPVLALAPVDSDGDGLADGWELHYGGSTTGLVADADDDGDGVDNAGEYAAGTDPGDTNSVLRLDPVFAASGEGFVLTWPSQTNRTYAVVRSPDLLQSFAPVATNIPATPPSNSYTNGTAEAAGFYEIEVEPPPASSAP